jgi:hypothetical protein
VVVDLYGFIAPVGARGRSVPHVVRARGQVAGAVHPGTRFESGVEGERPVLDAQPHEKLSGEGDTER